MVLLPQSSALGHTMQLGVLAAVGLLLDLRVLFMYYASDERMVIVSAKFQSTPRRSALVQAHMVSGTIEILASFVRLAAPLAGAAGGAVAVVAARTQVAGALSSGAAARSPRARPASHFGV